MIYVGHILAALVSLAAADFSWSLGVQRPYATALLAVVPILLAMGVRRLMLRGRFRAAAIGERLLSILPILLQWMAVTLFGWFETLEAYLGVRLSLESWPDLRLLYGLAPFLVYQVIAIDAIARTNSYPGRGIERARNFHLRFFFSALVPFLVYLTASTAVGQSEVVRINVEEVTLYSAALGLCLMGFLLWFLPGLIRRTWDTVPIEQGWLREMLEAVARQARFRFKELLFWRTGRQMSNAAIVGLTPKNRVVLFSDSLLIQLRPDELAAVFAHEIGHARRGHIVSVASWSLFFLLGAHVIVSWLGEGDGFVLLATYVTALTVWYFSFGYMSRRFELEADLESRELFGESGALIRALSKVCGSHGREDRSWRHFSPTHRMRFLQQVDRDPELGRKFQRRLRRWALVGRALCVVILLLQGIQIAQSWTIERLTAELRLGNYAEAMRLVEATRDQLDPQLVGLVEFGSRLPAGIGKDALEADGLRELEGGAIENAARYIELAILRGRRYLVPVYLALGAGENGRDLRELPEPWRKALRAYE